MSRVRRDQLLAELKRIREDGHLISASDYRTGTDLAVLVGNPVVGVSASLAIPVLAGGANEGKERLLLRAMKMCARKINEHLRLSPPYGGRDEEVA